MKPTLNGSGLGRKRFPEVWTQEFQDQLLVATVRDPRLLESAREIFDPEIFDDENRGRILANVLDFYDQYKKLPSKSTLVDLVKRSSDDDDDSSKLAKIVRKLYEQPLNDGDYIKDEALYAARSSAMKRALVRSATMLREGKLDEIEGVIRDATMVGQGTFDLGVSMMKDSIGFLRDEFEDKTNQVNIGYPLLMKAVGGLEIGELMTVMAPPNLGKSMALQNFSCGAWMRGHNVMIYSFELSERKTVLRCLARAARIDYKRLVESADDVRKTLRLIDKVSGKDLRIKFFPAKTVSLKALRSHILYLKANEFAPDMVTFDYADLIKASTVRKERREELTDLYIELRGLGAELDFFGLTATQSRRSSLNRAHLDLDDVAEDWGKVQVADAVAAICQTKEEFKEKMFRIFIAKSRGEMRGKQAYFKVNYDQMNMREMTRKSYLRGLPDFVKEKYGFQEFEEEEGEKREVVVESGAREDT